MFLAFSVLLVGWQACYALPRDDYVGPRDGYVGPPDGYVGPPDGYVGPPDGYLGPRDDYVGPLDGYVGPLDGYVGPRDGYVGPRDGYVGPRDGYVGPRDGYVGPLDGYVGPRDGYLSPSDIIAQRSEQFPKGFSFGVSTSSYQIEGAWDKEGKGENIWDRFLHTNRGYANGSNGDVAANGYYKVNEDIDLLRYLNVGHYRMSLSWARLLPDGTTKYINPKAVEHYRKQFRTLRKYNIEPFVTLYHWDLPQNLQDMGGFLNTSIISWYAEYARIAFDLFGDDVKYWATFNEPYQICATGYGSKLLAPGLDKSGTADYVCGHNLLRAHAAAYRIYDKEFRSEQGGKISICLGSQWIEPASAKIEDRIAAEEQLQFTLGWFANPIYNGDYPEVMKKRIGELSKLQKLKESRLPKFTKAELDFVKGCHDYFSLNTYGILSATAKRFPVYPISMDNDVGSILVLNEGSQAYGARELLVWIKKQYNDPSVIITENGHDTTSAKLDDPDRITYIRKTLNNVFDALTIDKVRVYGYTYWSLMDSFEWSSGYSTKYGLYSIDFKDPGRTRVPRKSAKYFKRLCTTGCTGEKCSARKDY